MDKMPGVAIPVNNIQLKESVEMDENEGSFAQSVSASQPSHRKKTGEKGCKKQKEDILCKRCASCNIIKTPRVYHCKVCDVCVSVHDHHCPWIGACIG
jgi:DHHC palmitoyltransferase